MSNYSENTAKINEFRKALKAELDDISEIDKTVMTKASSEGLRYVKKITPVDTGFLRRSWRRSPVVKSKKGISTSITNNADYALYVNDGHRIVNKKGETTGFVKGRYMVEHARNRVAGVMRKLFNEEVRKIKAKYDS